MTPSTHSANTTISLMLPLVRAGDCDNHRTMDEIRLNSLQRKQPQKAGGSGAFLRRVADLALDRLPQQATSSTRREVVRKVVQTHHSQFKRLPTELQEQYHCKARISKRRKCDANRDAIATLSSKIVETRKKKEEADAVASPLRSACVGWRSQDLQTLTEQFQGDDYSIPFVQQEWKRLLHCPSIPSEIERKAMADADDGSWEEVAPACPAWVLQACRQRQAFSQVALVFGETLAAPTFVLGHASQSPMWACFYELRRAAALGASSSSTGPAVETPRHEHRANWRVQLADFLRGFSFFFENPHISWCRWSCSRGRDSLGAM